MGTYRVRFENLSMESFLKDPPVPTQWGWMKIRNFPIDKYPSRNDLLNPSRKFGMPMEDTSIQPLNLSLG